MNNEEWHYQQIVKRIFERLEREFSTKTKTPNTVFLFDEGDYVIFKSQVYREAGIDEQLEG